MAEAVGLAVSICGLVAIALKAFKLCYNYLSEATNAQGDIVQLGSEIPTLASLLEPPLTPAKANKISQTHSDSISQLVPQCTEMLRQLQVGLQCQLRKQSDSRTRNLAVSSKTSLKWPFKKEESQNRIQKIKRLKATVTLKLQLWVTQVFYSKSSRAETIAETRGSEEKTKNSEKRWNESLSGSPANVPVNATQSSSQRESRALATGSWRPPSLLTGRRLEIRAQSCWVVALVCVHCRRWRFGIG